MSDSRPYSRGGRGGYRGRGEGGRAYGNDERGKRGRGAGKSYASSRRVDEMGDGDEPTYPKRESGSKRYSEVRKADPNKVNEKDVRRKDDHRYVDQRKDGQSNPERRDDLHVGGSSRKDDRHGYDDYSRESKEIKRTSQKQGRRGSEMKSRRGEDHLAKDDSKNTTAKADSHTKPEPVTGRPLKEDVKTASELEAQWQKEEELKAKEEELKRREEEEVKRKEEEERKRLEEEMERIEKEKREAEERDKKELLDFISDTENRLRDFYHMRELNLNASEEREAFEESSAKLDSSLKKNTSFVKKLKTMTEQQRDSLMKDINGLNLTKYIGECAAAIVEAKLKIADLTLSRDICCTLHRRYAEFSTHLLENWQKVFSLKKDTKIAKDKDSQSKLKVDIKIFSDLISVGVLPEKEALPILGNILTCLVANDKEEHLNIGLVLSFLKHCGQDYCGLLSKSIRELSERFDTKVPNSTIFEENRQKACRNLIREYYTSLVKRSLKENEDIRSMDKANRRTLQTKGELSQERKEKYEAAVTAFNKLWINTQQLADILDQPLPELPTIEVKDDFDVLEEANEDGHYSFEAGGLWEDDETRQFYENLPDLKPLVPGILYKDSHQVTTSETVEILEGEMANLELEDVEDSTVVEDLEEEMPEVTEEEEDEDESRNPTLQAMDVPEETEEALDMGLTMKQMMEGFVASLPNCVNRELIDHTAKDFAMNMNTKTNRKRLVKALFTVHRSRLDLLPFYSRLVATLDPLMPDVAADLCNCLRVDFKWHVRRKDQINLESKNKTVRFVGEMVKFNLFPRADALNCLKMLLFDFRHHNIQMACGIFECCGRFLFRSPDSHQRTKVYLETMMRKKLALNIDSRYVTMIENAFYYCNPPEQEKAIHKQRPPLHQYVRKLLFKDLNKLTVEKVLKQLRKLNWHDPNESDYAIKCLSGAWNVKYNNIHCLANLLAGLALYHDWVGIQVVDAVVEDIRLLMEMNHARFNQRRISMTKYVGELYNYRMVDSSVIFNTLYSFITFGVNTEAADGSDLDPPEHLFRLRLACTLLDTCGQYFDRGSSKKKLDCYLKYLLRYYWFKKSWVEWDSQVRPFPIDVEYMMQDTIDNLKPKYKMPGLLEEACENVMKMEEELRRKVAPLLQVHDQNADKSETLATIAEAEEEAGYMDLKFDEEEDEDDDDDDDGDRRDQMKFIEGEEREGSSQSQSQPDPGTNDGEEDVQPSQTAEEAENEDDDSDLSMDTDDDDDTVTILNRETKVQPCQEDTDFMSAFDKMLYDSIQQRNQENVKPPQVDIAVPSNLKSQVLPKEKCVVKPPDLGASISASLGIPNNLAPTHSPSSIASSPQTPARISEEKEVFRFDKKIEEEEENFEKSDESEEDDDDDDDHNGIDFILITRKGNKQNYHTLNVPLSVEFAAKLREREAAQRQEKEKMKQLTLERLEQMEEEEAALAQIGANQRVPFANNYRGKSKFTGPPRGAPDANLIFGVKPRYIHQKGVPDNVAEQFGSGFSSGGNPGGNGGSSQAKR